MSNTALGYTGGVILAKKSKVNVTECYMTHNTAEYGGALAAVEESGIYFQNRHQVVPGISYICCNRAKHGGGIYLSESVVTFGTKVNISHNNATEEGGGVYAVNSSIKLKSKVVFDAW